MEATLAVYEFRCNGCDLRWEEDAPDKYAKNARHLRNDKVCGNIVRVWQASLLRENIRAVKKDG